MKPFQFRLVTLLRLREAVRDQRRLQLADALRVGAALEEQSGELEQRLAEARRAQAAPAGMVDVDRLLEAQRYELALEMERRRLVRQQETVAQEIAQRRNALVAADQEVRALDKLREAQAQQWQEEHARRESKEMDEVAGRAAVLGGRR